MVKDTTYEDGVSDATKIEDGFLETVDAILLSADVDLATDAVDLGIETQKHAECAREMGHQTLLTEG